MFTEKNVKKNKVIIGTKFPQGLWMYSYYVSLFDDLYVPIKSVMERISLITKI